MKLFTQVLSGRSSSRISLCCVLVAAYATQVFAAEKSAPSTIDNARVTSAVNKAVDYFKQAQAKDGSFSLSSGPGITAIVGAALLRAGRTPQDPVVAKTLKY